MWIKKFGSFDRLLDLGAAFAIVDLVHVVTRVGTRLAAMVEAFTSPAITLTLLVNTLTSMADAFDSAANTLTYAAGALTRMP